MPAPDYRRKCNPDRDPHNGFIESIYSKSLFPFVLSSVPTNNC